MTLGWFKSSRVFIPLLDEDKTGFILHNSSTAAAEGTKRFILSFQCKNNLLIPHTCAVLS